MAQAGRSWRRGAGGEGMAESTAPRAIAVRTTTAKPKALVLPPLTAASPRPTCARACLPQRALRSLLRCRAPQRRCRRRRLRQQYHHHHRDHCCPTPSWLRCGRYLPLPLLLLRSSCVVGRGRRCFFLFGGARERGGGRSAAQRSATSGLGASAPRRGERTRRPPPPPPTVLFDRSKVPLSHIFLPSSIRCDICPGGRTKPQNRSIGQRLSVFPPIQGAA